MHYFLPANLNLAALLAANPPKFKHNIDCFTYIIGQITGVAARYKDLIDEQGYVPLHAPLLKLRVHNYFSYMKYLIENGVIECSGKYEPGARSKGYRFAEHYRTSPIISITITKRTLIKSIQSKDNWTRNMEAKYHFLHRWFDDKLSIDYAAATEMNEQMKLHSIESCDNNAYLRFNANQANIIRLKEHDYYFNVDCSAGRLHTNLTALKKELRQYVHYDGQILASVDVVASQPFLIGNLLLSPYFTEKENKSVLSYHSVWGRIRKEMDLAQIRKHTQNLDDDAALFKLDCATDFYSAFMDRIKLAGIEIYLDRDTVKKATYMILYSKNGYFSQNGAEMKRIFKVLYPSVYALLEVYKKRTHTALPVLLQHVEAQVILSGVARGISKRKKDVPLYSLHDSLVLPASEIALCKEAFDEVYSTLVGAVPPLNTKLWAPEQ